MEQPDHKFQSEPTNTADSQGVNIHTQTPLPTKQPKVRPIFVGSLILFILIIVAVYLFINYDNRTSNDKVATGNNPCATSPVSNVVKIAFSEKGRYLTDENCNTLYINSADIDGKPTCVDDCVTIWKPLYYSLDVSKFSAEIYREINIVQVYYGVNGTNYYQYTHNSYPLFSYRGDVKPGDMMGDGLEGGIWAVAYLEDLI